MLKIVFVFLFLTLTPHVFAGSNEGLEFEGAIGRPSVRISNPDNTMAGYDGIALQGRVLLPLLRDDFSAYLLGSVRYEDLENTSASDNAIELAKHKGFGFGAKLTYQVFYAGYEQLFMTAQHYLVGPVSNHVTYDYTAAHVFAGLQYQMSQVRFGLGYGLTTGAIAKDEVSLSRDSQYEEQTIWFHITYTTNVSVTKMASGIVKRK